MSNPIRDYDWGSPCLLARMQGRLPTGRAEAELWMGAHPASTSALIGLDGTLQPLDLLLERHPQALLGSDVLARHGARLPYLLKILAIAKPLSLQVHPDPGRAHRKFQQSNAKGKSNGNGDGSGHCSDPFAKPEMLYALRPVDAMCGFRHAADALDLLQQVDCPRLAPLIDRLSSTADPQHRLENVFALLVTWPEDDRAALVTEIACHARRVLRAGDGGGAGTDDPARRRTLMWTARLAALFPRDPLVAAPLLLEVVHLDPGETMFIPAGAPHAYLAGLGVEIMANSDNVLRAGLTHKEIAVQELLEVIDGQTRPIRDIPEVQLGPCEVAWRPAVEEFQLSRLRLPDSTPIACYPRLRGPQVLLCTGGTVGVATPSYALALRPGESAFVGASGGPITLAGPGEVFRAAVGEPRD
jgi:mannose-6-phosphate isomerase